MKKYFAPEFEIVKYEINESIMVLDSSGVIEDEDKGGYGPVVD